MISQHLDIIIQGHGGVLKRLVLSQNADEPAMADAIRAGLPMELRNK